MPIFSERIRLAATQTVQVQLTHAKLTEIAKYTKTPTLTPTSTLTQTITPSPTVTFTPTIGFNTKAARPTEEITYCLQDALNPAGIRVIARWPGQNKRGLYIAVEQRTGIEYFRVNGWGYLPQEKVNQFSGVQESGVCGGEKIPWRTWSDVNSINPEPGSIISIEFLDVNQAVVVTITFQVNTDGNGLTHMNIQNKLE